MANFTKYNNAFVLSNLDVTLSSATGNVLYVNSSSNIATSSNVYIDSSDRLRATTFNVGGGGYLSWDSTNNAIKVSFA